MQCEYFQGFLCSPGLPAAEFRQLLGKSTHGLAQFSPQTPTV
jgi:EAL domain-containing protein (putative c-di-GMP-specific phosphodiesterase class I)